jgi:flagellum-specific peptidoglycan hydrolase FlgJ
MTEEQKKFIETVGTLARTQKSSILPSVTVAQAILESGWGKSGLTVKANALFGIKAGTGWTGRVYSCKTQECYDGVNFTSETGCFRAYDNWAESISDHASFLCGLQRYSKVIGEKSYRTVCNALQTAGYATDPQYAEKLIRLIETYKLTEYDGSSYTVVKGDTLTKIASVYGTTIEALLEKNRARYSRMTRDYIQIGWVLEI